MEEYEKKEDEYTQRENQVKQLIYETVSNQMFIILQKLPTATEIWTRLCEEYKDKSDMVIIDTCQRLQNMHCPKDRNICNHFAEIMRLQEELEGIGAAIEDTEFATIIIGSLPPSYRSVSSTILAAA